MYVCMSTLLAKVAAIHEALGLPPGLAAGPMLACEAMGIQPGHGTTLPPMMGWRRLAAAAAARAADQTWDGIRVKK